MNKVIFKNVVSVEFRWLIHPLTNQKVLVELYPPLKGGESPSIQPTCLYTLSEEDINYRLNEDRHLGLTVQHIKKLNVQEAVEASKKADKQPYVTIDQATWEEYYYDCVPVEVGNVLILNNDHDYK